VQLLWIYPLREPEKCRRLLTFGQLKNGYAAANEETSEVGLFNQAEIPWKELAFPVVTEALTRYFEMRQQRDKRVYCADIFSRPGAPVEIVRHPS